MMFDPEPFCEFTGPCPTDAAARAHRLLERSLARPPVPHTHAPPRLRTALARVHEAAHRDWVREIALFIGPGFHPDTRGGDYIRDGRPCFTREQADGIDADLEACFAVLGDEVYSIACAVLEESP